MNELGTAEIGALLGATGAALVLIADRRTLLIAGLAALTAAEGLLVTASSPLRHAAFAMGLAGIVVLGAAAAGFVRHPALVTPIVLAAAPFRAPFEFDMENRLFVTVAESGDLGRLLPLYAVLGAASLALVWRAMRGEPVAPLPRPIAYPTAAFLAFASLSLFWTPSLDLGIDVLAFFLLPFAVLLATVGRAPFPAWMPKALAGIAVGLASIFAIAGLIEAATGRLLFGSPGVDVGNTFRSFFRVTSFFRDPSIFGRHLVLALIVVVAALLLSRLDVRVGVVFVALLGAALFFTYSQSSMAALFVAVLFLLLAIAPSRMRVAFTVAAVALVAVSAVAVASEVQDGEARRATSGRSIRAEDTARVLADKPVVGAGIGGQPAASRQLAGREGRDDAFVSHTTPLTVGAELGIIGLLLYAALLAGAAWTIDQVRRRDRTLGLTLGAAFVALFVHALTYSGFFEDPLTWFVLAVASSFLISAAAKNRTATP
jgi:O-antigen ligase